MNKIVMFAIIFVVILIISLVGLNFLANFKLKKTYKNYYNVACEQQGIDNPFAHSEYGTKALLCSDTNGCFVACGSACPPEQKLSFLKTFEFFKKEECTTQCVPQCVCRYGEKFQEENGCVK